MQLSQIFSRLIRTEPSSCCVNDKNIVVSKSYTLANLKRNCYSSSFAENSVHFKHYSSSLSASSALHSSQLNSSSHLSITITPLVAVTCTVESDVMPDTITVSRGMPINTNCSLLHFP